MKLSLKLIATLLFTVAATLHAEETVVYKKSAVAI